MKNKNSSNFPKLTNFPDLNEFANNFTLSEELNPTLNYELKGSEEAKKRRVEQTQPKAKSPRLAQPSRERVFSISEENSSCNIAPELSNQGFKQSNFKSYNPSLAQSICNIFETKIAEVVKIRKAGFTAEDILTVCGKTKAGLILDSLSSDKFLDFVKNQKFNPTHVAAFLKKVGVNKQSIPEAITVLASDEFGAAYENTKGYAPQTNIFTCLSRVAPKDFTEEVKQIRKNYENVFKPNPSLIPKETALVASSNQTNNRTIF